MAKYFNYFNLPDEKNNNFDNIFCDYKELNNFINKFDLDLNNINFNFLQKQELIFGPEDINNNNQEIINLNSGYFKENIIKKIKITIKKNSSVKIINNLEISDSIIFQAINFNLEENSSLILINLQKTSSQAVSYIYKSFNLSNNCNLKIVDLISDYDSKINFIEQNFNFSGQNSNLNYLNLSSLKDSGQTVLITNQNHLSADTQSFLEAKASIKDKSRFFFSGSILIEKACSNIQAEQQQNSFLLSPNAKNCSIPSLEIKNNDVICKHGSASGTFDPALLFYLSLRGLDLEQSKELIISGFFLDNKLIKDLNLDNNNSLLKFLD